MSGEGFIQAAPSCSTCGAGTWHPDVRNCALPHCELRARSAPETGAEVHPLPSAPVVPSLIQSPVHNAGVPAVEVH